MHHVYEELGETSRRQILSELSSGPKNVTDLVLATGLRQPNVSNHLARMRSKGIVNADKVGRQVFYSLANEEVASALKAIFADRPRAEEPLDLATLARGYAKAAVQGDELICGDIVEKTVRARLPLLEIYQELLTPAMGLVGAWYQVEAIDEAQEHMASAITERMMARVIQSSPLVRSIGRTAILGCPPDSWHTIGLRMISDYLRSQGWRTLFLGANVPYASFLSAVSQHAPDMVLLSCCSKESFDSSQELIRKLNDLRSARLRYLIGIGGGCVVDRAQTYLDAGADFTGCDLRSFAERQLPTLTK